MVDRGSWGRAYPIPTSTVAGMGGSQKPGVFRALASTAPWMEARALTTRRVSSSPASFTIAPCPAIRRFSAGVMYTEVTPPDSAEAYTP